MILTNENYFSKEAQEKYMGSSQFKAFDKCEYAAMAEIKGEYEIEKTTSLLVGSYVDSHFEGTLDIFKAQHPELFKRDGSLKSEYINAENVINRIERDELFMEYMSGEKQVIKTGAIDGVPFKIKIDSYFPGKMIVDLKVMKDFEPIYVTEKGRLNFIEAWGYDIQAAIYQAIEGEKLPFYIAAATKEKEPNIEIIHIPQENIDVALEYVKSKIQRFQAIKDGIVEPERCGACDFCKRNKVLSEPIEMEDLDYAE